MKYGSVPKSFLHSVNSLRWKSATGQRIIHGQLSSKNKVKKEGIKSVFILVDHAISVNDKNNTSNADWRVHVLRNLIQFSCKISWAELHYNQLHVYMCHILNDTLLFRVKINKNNPNTNSQSAFKM